jgi:hypothetical protein
VSTDALGLSQYAVRYGWDHRQHNRAYYLLYVCAWSMREDLLSMAPLFNHPDVNRWVELDEAMNIQRAIEALEGTPW